MTTLLNISFLALLKLSLYSLIIILSIILCITIIVYVRWHYYSVITKIIKIEESCLYIGRVKHTRLKGGAIHHLHYPIFFSYLNLKEIDKIGWLLYPIFKVNGGWTSFCSFDYIDHLKDWNTTSNSLIERLDSYIKESSKNKLTIETNTSNINIMTHLTYFGYCFNPVSFYYIFENTSKSLMHAVVAEVGNTPWNEQHSYVLHEDIPNVTIKRNICCTKDSSSEQLLVPSGLAPSFEAIWFKDFHVSPFMEMDYKYHFVFSIPAEKVAVQSKMLKISTNEVWFTAHFELERISFTPFNLLYVLIFYPLHTRIIQLWIHIEAVKIYLKGVPTFEHPQGTDVNFGLGITGKKLIYLYELLSTPINIINQFCWNILSSCSSKSNKKES